MLFDSNAVPCLAAFAVGLLISAEPDIRADTMSRHFGLASFGRCCSLACGSMIVSGGVGPVLIACLASGGSYAPALAVFATGLLAVAFLPRFGSRPEP